MPKLSLRDLLAIITFIAVLTAWWVDHRQLSRLRDAVHQDLIHSQLEATVSRQQLEATGKILRATIQELQPERIGTDFEVSIEGKK